ERAATASKRTAFPTTQMDIVTHLESRQIKDGPPPEAGGGQKEARLTAPKPTAHTTLLPVVITTEVVSEDERASQLAINDRGESVPLNPGRLTPSGPPDSHRQFSLQDFKKSFYDQWMKDKSVEKSNPFGFHSASATPNRSGSQSPTAISYAQSLARRGSLSGSQN